MTCNFSIFDTALGACGIRLNPHAALPAYKFMMVANARPVQAYSATSRTKWTAGRPRWMGAHRMSGCPRNYTPSSGNRAFDEYRKETLRRLEEEQREFRECLDRSPTPEAGQ